jgi:invasion protein IalB
MLRAPSRPALLAAGVFRSPRFLMYDLRYPSALLLAAVLGLDSGVGLAQQRTTATYEDWVLQCQVEAGAQPRKACDIAQVTQLQGRNTPFSRIAVLRPVKGQAIKLVVQVPVNVSFSAHVRIQLNDSDPGLAVPFTRCTPAGCFAEVELRDDVVHRFRTAAEPGKLTFKNANGQEVAVPISFKGFGPAFDSLAKE